MYSVLLLCGYFAFTTTLAAAEGKYLGQGTDLAVGLKSEGQEHPLLGSSVNRGGPLPKLGASQFGHAQNRSEACRSSGAQAALALALRL